MHLYTGHIIYIAMVIYTSVKGAPVGKDLEKSRDAFVKVYDQLRQPLKDIMFKTQNAAMAFAKEKKLENVAVHESFKESCESHIGKNELKSAKDRQKRFIYAMKIYQELVKQLQIMQVRESALNKERYTIFTNEFLGIEFKLRNFVETNLRHAAKVIVGIDQKKQVPLYSTGNSHTIEVKDAASDAFNTLNLQVLNAVLFCSKNFLYNDIVKVAGKDRFMEEGTVKMESKIPESAATEPRRLEESVEKINEEGGAEKKGLTNEEERVKHQKPSEESISGMKEGERLSSPLDHLKKESFSAQEIIDRLEQRLLEIEQSKKEPNWDHFKEDGWNEEGHKGEKIL